MIKTIIRAFLKITGALPYYLVIKPKLYFSSYKAKLDSKKKSHGTIIVSNHTHIFDYYVFLYHHFFHVVHTMVAEIVYNRPFLSFLNWVMGNIKIKNNPDNVKAVVDAARYLKKNKYLLIFPEGHLEKTKGELEDFKTSAITLAWDTNTPIQPYYIDGNYGLFKRLHYIAGEKINLHDLVKKDTLNDEDVLMIKNYLMNRIKELKHQMALIQKHHTQNLAPRTFFAYDLAKVLCLPWIIFFPTKIIYEGDKKKVKRVLKDQALIASNHLGFFDPVAMTLKFPSRRIRFIGQEDLWQNKIMGSVLRHAGVVSYHRKSMEKFDINFVILTKEILEAKGVVGIYPEGHINFTDNKLQPFMGGAAMLSLICNTPIIPFVFKDKYRPFHINKIMIGEPMMPKDVLGEKKMVDNKAVEDYNNYLYNKMNNLHSKLNEKD